MKSLIKVFIANFILFFIFANIYINIKNHFKHNDDEIVTNMDCWLFSSTIQAGCGFTYITPTTNLSKTIIMTQVLILITTHIIPIIIYFA